MLGQEKEMIQKNINSSSNTLVTFTDLYSMLWLIEILKKMREFQGGWFHINKRKNHLRIELANHGMGYILNY